MVSKRIEKEKKSRPAPDELRRLFLRRRFTTRHVTLPSTPARTHRPCHRPPHDVSSLAVYTIQDRDPHSHRTLRGQFIVSAPALAWMSHSTWTGRGYQESNSSRSPTLARRARSGRPRMGASGLKRAPSRGRALTPYRTPQKNVEQASCPCARLPAKNADGAAPSPARMACPRQHADASPGVLRFAPRRKVKGALLAACPNRPERTGEYTEGALTRPMGASCALERRGFSCAPLAGPRTCFGGCVPRARKARIPAKAPGPFT